MWLKWLPWRFILRNAAKKHGFLDPLEVLSRLQNFAQPSEVAAPLELLRAGVVFHARGLVNSQAIQHNLDWVWPYWVECQFNPDNEAFVPRAFSVTHVNLTHRNWTSVGVPDTECWPLVDPRGLVTPFLDGWSVDSWIIPNQGEPLIPSRCQNASQELTFEKNLLVTTQTENKESTIISSVKADIDNNQCSCFINVKGKCAKKGYLAVVLRPYNPEGISFIHEIKRLNENNGWKINDKQMIEFEQSPSSYLLSTYGQGDVFRLINNEDANNHIQKTHLKCKVGMATAAALFPLDPDVEKKINIRIPLRQKKKIKVNFSDEHNWDESLIGSCQLKIPDKQYQYLYDSAIRTLVLLSPGEVYPGPYTYRRFWFRDAAYIIYALLCAGFIKRAKRVLDTFPEKQTPLGHFLSQDGEWDSNGEALWVLNKYFELTGETVDPKWRSPIIKGTKWILRKRLSIHLKEAHAGLFPAGFSAEHLGPNDYYYWDNFWGVAGIKAASSLLSALGDEAYSKRYDQEAKEFMDCIKHSLEFTKNNLNRPAIPAAPYRRMDAGAIGSIVAGYPLQLFHGEDIRILDTINYLYENCFVEGGFFQDMTHSGINPYLTLHMAQVLLRANDSRHLELMQVVADLATPTGQWPEAIHPKTKGGCMGDGQHAWAAAEWILMIRNCFVREEGRRLILLSGIPLKWIDSNQTISFGPVLTSFGKVNLELKCNLETKIVKWSAQWHKEAPIIEIHLPGYRIRKSTPGQKEIQFTKKDLLCAS